MPDSTRVGTLEWRETDVSGAAAPERSGREAQQSGGRDENAPSEDASGSTGRELRHTIAPYGLVGFLAVMIVGLSVALPHTFPTWSNFSAIVSSLTVELVLCLALLFPLSAGLFDLSVAGAMAIAATVAALLVNDTHLPLALIVVAAMCTGMAFGVLNGFLVVKVGLHAFITTFGVASALTALGEALAPTGAIVIQRGGLLSLGQTMWLHVPLAMWIAIPLAAAVWYLFEATYLGRHIRATGMGQNAARLAGVPTFRLRFGAFVVAGVLYGVAGIMLLGTVGSIAPDAASAYLLPPYAALFLGTATIRLGEFSVPGTIVGLLVIAVGTTGLELFGLAGWVTDMFQGVALVVGLLIARLISGQGQVIAGGVGG
jgi:ribose transport system permease protein